MLSTKEKIKKTAYKLFAQRGYNASLDDIARKVGIKTPSLYTHFSSKEDLFYQVIKVEIEGYFADLEKQFQLLENKNSYDQISGIFFSVINYFKENSRARFWRNIPLIKEERMRNKIRRIIQQNDMFYTNKMLGVGAKISDKELSSKVSKILN